MFINIETLLYSIMASITKIAGQDYSKLKEVAEDFKSRTEVRMKEIAQDRLDGKLTNAEVVSYMKDEILILQNNLLALSIIGKQMVEDLVNGAIAIAEKILKEILPAE